MNTPQNVKEITIQASRGGAHLNSSPGKAEVSLVSLMNFRTARGHSEKHSF